MDTSSPSLRGDERKRSTEILRTVSRLVGSELIVTMTDGRIATGRFVCLDRSANIILSGVTESRDLAYVAPTQPSVGQYSALEAKKDKLTHIWRTERQLTQAVIPGERLAKVQVSKKDYSKAQSN